MAKKKLTSDLHLQLTHVTRTLFFFIGFYMLSIIIFDSWNLITSEAVVDRWTAASVLLAINTLAWILGARQNTSATMRVVGTWVITISLLVFAGFATYWERGMASTSTLLYVLPLLVIATIKNRHALLAAATLSAGTYSFAAVKYFNDYFNEGYRIQLWGNLLLYSGIIFVCAWMIMIIADLRHDSR